MFHVRNVSELSNHVLSDEIFKFEHHSSERETKSMTLGKMIEKATKTDDVKIRVTGSLQQKCCSLAPRS